MALFVSPPPLQIAEMAETKETKETKAGHCPYCGTSLFDRWEHSLCGNSRVLIDVDDECQFCGMGYDHDPGYCNAAASKARMIERTESYNQEQLRLAGMHPSPPVLP